jgi:membrane protein DedA with SNARE-associated domain
VVERIIDFFRQFLSAPWGYIIVGAATFLENSVGAGVVVPGETLVILGGFYARVGDLLVPWVAFAAVLGAVVGDNTGYLIGRRYGRDILERHGRKLLITPERLERADRYYEAHGGKTVFLGRFIPVVRSVGCILAGVAHMDWRRFFAYDVVGALIWGIGHTLLGYFVGASYERWKKYLTPIGIAIGVVLLLAIGLTKLLAARRSVRREIDELEPPGEAHAPGPLKVPGEAAED